MDDVTAVELIKGRVLTKVQAWKPLDEALMDGVRERTASLAGRALYDALLDMPSKEYHYVLKAIIAALHERGLRLVELEE